MGELAGVILGGVLAILGGAVGQALAAKARQNEAQRERLEMFRQDATNAALLSFDVVQGARPDSLSLFRTAETYRAAMEALSGKESEAGRALMALSIGRTGGPAATEAARAAETLRGKSMVTVGVSSHHANQVFNHMTTTGDFDNAQRVNNEARAALKAFEEFIKALGRPRRRRWWPFRQRDVAP